MTKIELEGLRQTTLKKLEKVHTLNTAPVSIRVKFPERQPPHIRGFLKALVGTLENSLGCHRVGNTNIWMYWGDSIGDIGQVSRKK